MSSLLRLFGKDTRFYDLLEASASEAGRSASLIGKLLAKMGDGPLEELLGELDQCRRKHKRLSQETSEAVAKTFVTPIEREDIEALSAALYKITKTAEKLGERLTMCPPGANLSALTKQVSMYEQSAAVIAKMVAELRFGSHGEQIRDFYERLQALEGEADRVMNDLLRELYRSDADPRQVVYWKDIYELLEKGVDRCRDAGYVVYHIVLKNS